MKRNRILVTMVVMKVTLQFLQAHGAGKTGRKSNHPERMSGAIINGLAIFGDAGFFHVPGWGDHPTVMFARTRYSEDAKRQLFAKQIYSAVISQRAYRPVKRGELLQNLHHGFHGHKLVRQIIRINPRQGQSLILIQVGHPRLNAKTQPASAAAQKLEEGLIETSVGIKQIVQLSEAMPKLFRNSKERSISTVWRCGAR